MDERRRVHERMRRLSIGLVVFFGGALLIVIILSGGVPMLTGEMWKETTNPCLISVRVRAEDSIGGLLELEVAGEQAEISVPRADVPRGVQFLSYSLWEHPIASGHDQMIVRFWQGHQDKTLPPDKELTLKRGSCP